MPSLNIPNREVITTGTDQKTTISEEYEFTPKPGHAATRHLYSTVIQANSRPVITVFDETQIKARILKNSTTFENVECTLLDNGGGATWPGSITARNFYGEASSATRLASACTISINGVSKPFDGTSDISWTGIGGFGAGSWRDLTSSRLQNVIYYNQSGSTIMVAVTGADTYDQSDLKFFVNEVLIYSTAADMIQGCVGGMIMVPAGASYRIVCYSHQGSANPSPWMEFRND